MKSKQKIMIAMILSAYLVLPMTTVTAIDAMPTPAPVVQTGTSTAPGSVNQGKDVKDNSLTPSKDGAKESAKEEKSCGCGYK